MAKITVEEPRSVVEEVEKFECDSCSRVVNKENAYFVETIPVTDSGGARLPDSMRTAHLCDTCVEADSYMSYMELIDRRENRMKMLASGLNKSLYVVPTAASISLSIVAGFFPNTFALLPLDETLTVLVLMTPVIFIFVVWVLIAVSPSTSVIQ